MHLALWILAAVSLAGAGISLLRPTHVGVEEVDAPRALEQAAA